MGTTRTRTRPVVTSSLNCYRKTYSYSWENGKPTKLSSISTSYVSEEIKRVEETMTDTVTPNFKKLSSAGQIFNNSMTHVKKETTTVPTTGSIYMTAHNVLAMDVAINYVRERAVPVLTAPSHEAAAIASMNLAAGTQAMSRVSSEEILLLASLGELKETKDMLIKAIFHLRHIDKLLKHYYNVFRYGHKSGKDGLLDWNDWNPKSFKEDWPQFKRQTKQFLNQQKTRYLELENIWMSIRMGWRPFVGECMNLHNAVMAKKENPARQTFRGKAADQHFHRSDYYTSTQARTCIFKRSYQKNVSVRSGTLAQQRAYIGFPDTWGLTKLPQTVWELTTLSWAVDYFFNVGELIAAYTPDTLWEPICSWTTVRSMCTQVTELMRSYQVDGSLSPDLKGGMKIYFTDTTERIPSSSIGLTFRPRMNWAKYTDMVAVTRQQLSKTIAKCMSIRTKRRR